MAKLRSCNNIGKSVECRSCFLPPCTFLELVNAQRPQQRVLLGAL
jgi:hypothetical protein